MTSLGIDMKNNIFSFSQKSTLPLYKDKPFSPLSKSAQWEKRKAMIFKASAIFFAFYTCYYIGHFLKSSRIGTNEAIDWSTAQNRVRDAMKSSWASYEAHGWGMDEYSPISHKGKNMGPEPLGWIIIDSLDTLHLMGLEDELKVAESWVANELNYDFDYDVNVFETTIRMLGGLLSAHYLTGKEMYLEKAVKLGDKIIGSFESRSGLPYASVNLKTGKGKRNHVDGGASSTAEVATLQLEFKHLASLTGESLYWDKVSQIMSTLDANTPEAGLVPIYVHPDTGKYQGQLIRLGSRGDSYYEYLLKQYLQTREPVYQEMYKESIAGMKKHLLRYSEPNKLAFFGELEQGINGPFSNKMDHLVCFMGGLLALGATEGLTLALARKQEWWNPTREEDMNLAREITHTCYKMYAETTTGLSPEIVVFNTDKSVQSDFIIKPADRHNLQRPETVESLFVLSRITGDDIYKQWGWNIFQSFETYTKLADGGYTSLNDVTTGEKRDNMESFWMAETLKYLYLLFQDESSDTTIADAAKWDLKNIVFNTEAHPLPILKNIRFKTGWERKHVESNAGKVKEYTSDWSAAKLNPSASANIKEDLLKVKPNR